MATNEHKKRDQTRSRQQARRAELDKLAQANGYPTMYQFLTAWKNGDIEVTVVPNIVGYLNE